MKSIFTIIFFNICFLTLGQNRPTLNIIVNSKNSEYFDLKYKKSVDSAFVIMNAVFNSKEFQDLYTSQNFPCWNNCIVENCAPNKNCTDSIISGKVVLDSLFKETDVSMTVNLKKRSHSALGSTCPKNYYTTAFYKNIIKDMPNLPLSYAIAVNLCHEYMHHIGFCHYSNSFNQPDAEHPDPIGYQKDIAYRVGWDAYFILKRWKSLGIQIQGI